MKRPTNDVGKWSFPLSREAAIKEMKRVLKEARERTVKFREEYENRKRT